MRTGPSPWHRTMRTESSINRVRWAAVLFGVFQALTFYRSYPPGVLAVVLWLLAGVAVANLLLIMWLRTLRRAGGGEAAMRRFSLVALVFDACALMLMVFAYTFDADTAMFALVYVVPLLGAVRFQRAGALWSMAGATVLYVLREWFGATVYGHELLPTSITFRMGIGFIIAGVAGAMASSLLRERDELRAATTKLARQARALRRQAEQLESTNAELQAANKVKDEFLAMTNHELRTPLTTILGYTTLLAHRWDEIEDGHKRDYLARIAEQGSRLLTLVEDLLLLSSGVERSVRLQAVSVQQAVTDALRAAMPHGMDGPDDGLRLDVAPQLKVLADRGKLVQVLTNLLSNAHKYGDPPITITAAVVGGHVEIAVIDSGPGVPAEFVPQLFERFTQASSGTSRTAEGTGLGLAIVRDLAQVLGGSCRYEPVIPTGARFVVSLPTAQGRHP